MKRPKLSLEPDRQTRGIPPSDFASPEEDGGIPKIDEEAPPLNESVGSGQHLQGLATEELFYFFLRMRKNEVRRIVGILQSRYPEETPAQLARRLIASKSALSMLGGSLLTLPLLMPGVGQALKLVGLVGATSMLTRMHLYMILEIALLFGKDIDDKARVSEMAAVVATTGLAAASPLLARNLGLDPRLSLPLGTLSAAAATQLIGRGAIALYARQQSHGGLDDLFPEETIPA
jgi:hypothetical protein